MTDEPSKTSSTTPRQRPTEPLPTSYRPFWLFLLFIFLVVAGIAASAYLVDRAFYG
jgi:hypothetical protein